MTDIQLFTKQVHDFRQSLPRGYKFVEQESLMRSVPMKRPQPGLRFADFVLISPRGVQIGKTTTTTTRACENNDLWMSSVYERAWDDEARHL